MGRSLRGARDNRVGPDGGQVAGGQTRYAWFGGKQGLFTALIRRQAEAANQAVAAALDDEGADPAAALTAFATNLLKLLLGERSVALNRAGSRPASWRPCCWPRAATAPPRPGRRWNGSWPSPQIRPMSA